MKAIIRKEVHLSPTTVRLLERIAKANNSKLKPWMESILTTAAQKAKQKKIDPHTAGGGYNEWHLSDMQ